MRKTQAELTHVTRVASLGELTTSIAHEVNQPLAAIVISGHSCLRWLDAEMPNLPEARETVNRMIRDGNRAADVIRGIRELLKKDGEEKAWLDINEVITEVIPVTRSELLKAQASLEVNLAPELPTVRGVTAELQQVMINLVMNAIEAMKDVTDRACMLSIKSDSCELDEGPGVLIAVRDTGVGIAEEEAHRLFDAFYTTKPQGLGMGLPISRSIVEAHGGRLWAVANDVFGATFQFVLPAASAA